MMDVCVLCTVRTDKLHCDRCRVVVTLLGNGQTCVVFRGVSEHWSDLCVCQTCAGVAGSKPDPKAALPGAAAGVAAVLCYVAEYVGTLSGPQCVL